MKRKFQWIVSLLFIFTVCGIIYYLNNTQPSNSGYTNEEDKAHEIVLVYIGSSSCPVCTDKENKVIFLNIYEKLKLSSMDNDFNLKTIGISVENSSKEDYDFLTSFFNQFDEMVVGGGTYNIGALRYLHEQFKGRQFVPQILILLREYNQRNTENFAINSSIKNETLLYRKVGLGEIEDFNSILDDIKLESFFEGS